LAPPWEKILPVPMTEYVLEEVARRAGGDGGLEKEDSSDSGKNAKPGGQTLFSMCFQNVCYKSHVNHLSVLDECDIEDITHVQSSSNKTTNPRWRCVQKWDSPRAAPIRRDLHPKRKNISEPSEYFIKFFDEPVMECIAELSNLYAVQTHPSKPLMLTCKELEIFLLFY